MTRDTTDTISLIIPCLLLLAGLAPGRVAAGGVEGERVSLLWENDTVVRADRHYTQGARVSYLSKDNALPDWLNSVSRRLPAFGMKIGAQKYGFGAGQEIYTPKNLSSRVLVVDDRPYAAWLYGRLTLERRGTGPGMVPMMDTVHLDLGLVGPEALGEQAQDVAHRNDPRGWNNQLRTEPGIALRCQRSLRFATKDEETGVGFDFLPYAGLGLGNIFTGASLGSTVRFGVNVPNDFALHNDAQAPPLGFYVFAGGEGRWVAHNIFLDGNTFRSSHSVHRIPFVADLRAGAAFVAGPFEFTAAYVLRAPEFYGQHGYDQFGSATVTFKF
jgi:hypothetical protein